MQSIKRRIARLEVVSREAKGKPLRLFVHVINRHVSGFLAHLPEGPSVTRQDGETVEELEARAAALHPGIMIWRSI